MLWFQPWGSYANTAIFNKNKTGYFGLYQLNKTHILIYSKYILEEDASNEANYLTEIILRRGCQARVLTKSNVPAMNFFHASSTK